MKLRALAVAATIALAGCSSTTAIDTPPPEPLETETIPAPEETFSDDVVETVEADPKTKVPKLEGKTLREARKEGKKANVRISVAKKKVSSAPEGTVISQSPKAGVKVEERSSVRVVLAKPAPEPSGGGGGGNCTAGYSPCLTPASDYDCAGGSGDGPKYVNGTVKVSGSDPYDLDSDNDGSGCE